MAGTSPAMTAGIISTHALFIEHPHSHPLKKPPKNKTPSLPSKAELLAFIAERPGKSGTREIARAFNLKNNLRAELKRLLRELADEGKIESRRKKLHHAGGLPDTILADIAARDNDGDLIATPDEWDEEANGAAPKILVHTPRKINPREAAGIGDRVLLRIEPTNEEDGFKYRGRVIRVLEKPKQRVLGIFHRAPDGGGRIEPVEKKQLGRELKVAAHASGGAQDGDLVSVEISKPVRLGPPQGKVTERLGSLKSEKAVSMIAIAAHSIPSVFRNDTLAEAEAAKPATMKNRDDWRSLALVTIDPPDAKDHDDAVHAAPDDAANNPGGFVLTVAIADVGLGARPRGADPRQFGLFPGSCGAHAAGAHLERSVLAAPPRRAARNGRAHGDRRRRPQAHAHFPSHHDALGRAPLLPTSAGRDRRPPGRHHRSAPRWRAASTLCRL
jgi:ribonuclease R